MPTTPAAPTTRPMVRCASECISLELRLELAAALVSGALAVGTWPGAVGEGGGAAPVAAVLSGSPLFRSAGTAIETRPALSGTVTVPDHVSYPGAEAVIVYSPGSVGTATLKSADWICLSLR